MLTVEQRLQILDKAKALVLTRHINATNPEQDYQPWAEQWDAVRADCRSGSDEEFERRVQLALAELESSHTAFFQGGGGTRVPAQYALNATLTAVEVAPDTHRWMLLDVLEDGPAHAAGIRPGHLLLQQEGEDVLPPSQPKFLLGSTVRLTITDWSGNGRQEISIAVPNRAAKDRPPMIEPRSVIYRLLDTGIGYVRVQTFPGANGATFARALDAALSSLRAAGADRLIVDLRGNMGGGIGSLRLMSYLCAGRLPVGYSLTRATWRKGFDKSRLPTLDALPTGKAAMLWMFVKFRLIHRDRSIVMFTEGLAQQPFHGRTVLLVNEHAKSAAEMVASFAQENGLAPLVGTRTAGEVLGGATFSVGQGYKLRIPVAGWYTWAGTCLEGVGVAPTVEVRQDPEELAAGIDTQLDRAIQLVRSQ